MLSYFLVQSMPSTSAQNQAPEEPQSAMTVCVDVKNVVITIPSSNLRSNYVPNVLAMRGILHLLKIIC